jgi:hypothetical protein
LPCSGNLDIAEEGDIAMTKIAVILALAFAITTGMVLTTTFAFDLLPLN